MEAGGGGVDTSRGREEEAAHGDHPAVRDIRGVGLFLGKECDRAVASLVEGFDERAGTLGTVQATGEGAG